MAYHHVHRPTYAVVTDASPEKMAALLPGQEIRRKALPGIIMYPEMQAALWGIASAPPRSRIHVRIDNQASMYALRKGSSSDALANELVKLACDVVHAAGSTLHLEYVRSENNPADFGSRTDFTTPSRLKTNRAKRFEPTSSQDAKYAPAGKQLLLVDFPGAEWKLRPHTVVSRYTKQFLTNQGCWDVICVRIA